MVYSLLCEVELDLYPSSVEGVLVGFVEFGTLVFGRPFVLPRWSLYWLREEFGTPGCSCTKSSMEVPSVGVLGGQVSGLEILLGEGGDVELGARTSKHILLFAFDPLTLNSLSLSLFVLCIIHIIHILYACVVPCIILIAYNIYLCLACVCVPHLCLTTIASYSTSTLIQRNQEELVQSPSRGIRLHSLVVLSVVVISF